MKSGQKSLGIGIICVLLLALIARQSSGAKIEGRGDQLSEPITFSKGLLMVGAAHKGNRNFIVELLSTDGEKRELLVNVLGDYQGVRLVPVAPGRYRFQVQADQAWVLLHEQPVRNEVGTPLPIAHSHNGDAPLGPFALEQGLLRASLTHEGGRNFVAILYDSEGRMTALLVNKLGKYAGTVTASIRNAGNYWLAVEASGPWSVKLDMDE